MTTLTLSPTLARRLAITRQRLAEAETTPLQMGPLAGYCRGMIETLAEAGERLEPGAVYLHNDPFRGASHSPDIGAIAPLFAGDKLFGFAGTAAHHVDIGAAVPGTCIIKAHDTFSEGLRLRAYQVEAEGRPGRVGVTILPIKLTIRVKIQPGPIEGGEIGHPQQRFALRRFVLR